MLLEAMMCAQECDITIDKIRRYLSLEMELEICRSI